MARFKMEVLSGMLFVLFPSSISINHIGSYICINTNMAFILSSDVNV